MATAKMEELMFRWYNLSTLRGRVGQPGALSATKLDAEEAALRRETERLGLELEVVSPTAGSVCSEARAA